MKLLDALKDGSKVQYNGWNTDRYLQMEGNALFQYKDGERLSVSLFDFDLNSEKFDKMKAISSNGLHPDKKSLPFVTEQKALVEMEEKRDEAIKTIVATADPDATIGTPKSEVVDGLPNVPDGYRVLRKGTKPQSTDMVWMPISKQWQLVGKHKYGEVKHTGNVVRPINAPDVEGAKSKRYFRTPDELVGSCIPIPDWITHIPDGYEQLPCGTETLPADKLAAHKTLANGLTKWENIGARKAYARVGSGSIIVRKKLGSDTEQPITEPISAPIPELDFQPAYGTWGWAYISLFAHNEKVRRRAFIGEDYYWQMDANRVVTDSDGAVIDTENNLHTKECDWELYAPAIKPEVKTVSGVKFAIDASITNATILKGFFKWATYVFTGRDAQADEYLLVLGTQIDQYLDAKTGVKQ